MLLGIGVLTTAAVAATLGGSRGEVDTQPFAATVAADNTPPSNNDDTHAVAPVLEVQPASFTAPVIETVEPTFPALIDLPDGVIPVGSVVTVMVGDTPVSMSITDKGAVTILGDRRFVHEVSIPLAGWSRITILRVEKQGSNIITKGTAAGMENTSTRSIDEVTRMCAKALESGEFGYKVPSVLTSYNGRLREEKADVK